MKTRSEYNDKRKLKIERSINNLSKRIERFDPSADDDDERYWKGKEVIPFEEWRKLKGTHYGLKQFPDDFHQFRTTKTESELKDERIKRLHSDYLVKAFLMISNEETRYTRPEEIIRGVMGSLEKVKTTSANVHRRLHCRS